MGTRSLVLKPEGDAFVGRYVHWDGYPTGVGQSLLNIVQRDGLEMARRVIIDEHFYWSSIESRLVREQYDAKTKNYKTTDLSGFPIGLPMDSLSYAGEKRGEVSASFIVGYGEADLNSPKDESEYDDYLVTPGNYQNQGWCEWTYLMADNGLWVCPYDPADNPPRYQIVVPWDSDETLLTSYETRCREEADRLWEEEQAKKEVVA